MKINKLVIAIGGVAAIAAIATISASWYTVNNGEVAVIKRLGKIINEETPGGPYFKIPFMDRADIVNIQTQDNTLVIKGHTHDTQPITLGVSVQWSVAPISREAAAHPGREGKAIKIGDASRLVANYGSRDVFDSVVLDKRITEVANDLLSSKTLSEIIQNRAAFNESLKTSLTKILSVYPINVDGIQILSLDPSPEYIQAIEAQQVATVDAVTASKTAAKIRALADATNYQAKQVADGEIYKIQQKYKTEAEGIASVNRSLSSANEMYVPYIYATTWNGQYPLYMGGSGGSLEAGMGLGIGSTIIKK